jgi:predicted ArsR family transcriptional regulator
MKLEFTHTWIDINKVKKSIEAYLKFYGRRTMKEITNDLDLSGIQAILALDELANEENVEYFSSRSWEKRHGPMGSQMAGTEELGGEDGHYWGLYDQEG